MAQIVKGKNKNKPYTVRYWHESRQRERSFVTRREATDFIAQFEHSRREGTYVDPRQASETFGDAARRMIADQRNRNTHDAYEQTLNKHLASIVDRPLRAVASDRDGIKALCVNHPRGKMMLTVIRNTCDEAVKSGRLTVHRLQGLRANVVPGKRDLIPATSAQIETMAESMGPDGLAVRIMRSTGMRVSECLALRKVDFIQTTHGSWRVHVSRQVQNGRIVPLKHRRDFTGRDVPVTASLAALICARPDGDLFTTGYTSFRQRFATAAKRAGLPAGFTAHQLRHGFASTLLAGGIAITDVARWMGDEVRTVASTYAHLMPGQDDRALALLESDYAGKAQAA